LLQYSVRPKMPVTSNPGAFVGEQLEDWGLSQPESCAAASGSTFTIGGDCAGNHNGCLGVKFKEKRC